MGKDAHAFSPAQDVLSKSPSGPSRTWQAGMPAKRTHWGALSLGYFSLGTQREVTRSLRDRKRRRQCIHPRQTKTPRKIQHGLTSFAVVKRLGLRRNDKQVRVGWDEIPASPCLSMLGFHPSLQNPCVAKHIKPPSTQFTTPPAQTPAHDKTVIDEHPQSVDSYTHL